MTTAISVNGSGTKQTTQIQASPGASAHNQVVRIIFWAFGEFVANLLLTDGTTIWTFPLRGGGEPLDLAALRLNTADNTALSYSVSADTTMAWSGYIEVDVPS